MKFQLQLSKLQVYITGVASVGAQGNQSIAYLSLFTSHSSLQTGLKDCFGKKNHNIIFTHL